MNIIHVLYLGRSAVPVEQLLSVDEGDPTISVCTVPTIEAAIAQFPEFPADCLLYDVGSVAADPEMVDRLTTVVPAIPLIVRGDGPLPGTIGSEFPEVCRIEDNALVETVLTVTTDGEDPAASQLPSPPEALLSLLDPSADRVAHLDREGTYRSASTGLAELLGASVSELVGTTLADHAPDEDAEAIREHGIRALDMETIQRYEGRTHYYLFVPVNDEQFQLIVQDPAGITDRTSEPGIEFIDTVLNRLTDIFFVFDLRGNFLHWNDRLNEVTGYTDEEITTMTPVEFFVRDDYNRIDAAISEIVETGEATETIRIRTRNGQLRPYEFTGSMVTNEDGSPGYICGIARDVSGRRSERVLRERQQALPNLIRNLPGVIYRYRNEPGFPIEFMSEGCATLAGYSHERFESGDLSWEGDVIHPEDRAPVRAEVREAIDAGEQYRTTYRIRTADDEVRWVHEQGVSADDADGSVEYLDGYLTEVTDIVRIQRELRQEKAFTESALDAQPDLFYVFTPDGEVLRWNSRFTEVTGYTDEEIASMHPSDFVDTNDIPEIQSAIDQVSSEGVSLTVEATLVTKDDKRIPYEFTGSIIENGDESMGEYDDGESERYICGTGRDISQRVRAEAELEAAIDELERSNAELERFAYVASHDLKEPLRMIHSYLDLIRRRYEGELDEDADEFIGYAVDGAERMRGMIDDLLTYSRIGTADISFEPVDPNAVLDRVLADLRLTIAEENAEITADSLPTVLGDTQQLAQLFQNLINNAITYSGGANPRIHISATETEGKWRFSVSDNGVGIDETRAEDVFEIFSSGSGGDGTGIGLAVCKKIIERHGGEIWVESEPGIGSTFYFTLPDQTQRIGDESSRIPDV